MTLPNGYVILNSSTGSDTQASGLGPSTAVYGSAASITLDSNVVTGIDTTGVTAGDLLWVQSSTGRQFSIIASVDSATQVTCDDNFGVTESGRTWAIGGKRATLDNADFRTIFGTYPNIYSHELWIELETDQTITSAIDGYQAQARIKSSPGSVKTITLASGSSTVYAFATTKVLLDRIKIRCENSDHSVFWGVSSGGCSAVLFNCIIGESSYPIKTLGHGFTQGSRVNAFNTRFENIKITTASQYGFDNGDMHGWNCALMANGCLFYNCGGVHGSGSNVGNYYGETNRYSQFTKCIFIGDGSTDLAGPYLPSFKNCIITNYRYIGNITTDAIPYATIQTFGNIKNCLIHNVDSILNISQNALDIKRLDVTDNFFYNVGSFSNLQGIESYIGLDNTTLTADPLDVVNDTVQINNSVGGGNLVRNSEIKL